MRFPRPRRETFSSNRPLVLADVRPPREFHSSSEPAPEAPPRWRRILAAAAAAYAIDTKSRTGARIAIGFLWIVALLNLAGCWVIMVKIGAATR